MGPLWADEGTPAAAPSFRFRPQPLEFRHDPGRSGKRYIVETMGSGVALLDFDGDGDLDVYLLQAAPLPGSQSEPSFNQLLENQGSGRFVDATQRAGLADSGYAMGAAVGDVDNDGDPDLYLAQFGRDVFYRNEGGRFIDRTQEAGLGNPKWGASCAFFDYDGDGFLDLYVTHYLAFTVATHKECTLGRGIQAYCSPDAYPGAADVLYRNRGDGTFEDVTAKAGLSNPGGKGLGVLCGDFDRDGRADIYVANDGVGNNLFLNRGKGRFTDETLVAGVGFSESGMAQAGMGVTGGDLNGDGWSEIFVTNLSAETNVLYRGGKDAFFSDGTVASGLGPPSLLFTGFGTVSADFDHDGDLDLFVANGHIIDNITEFFDYYTYEQPDQFYRNDGGRFVEVTSSSFTEAPPVLASRGAARGDLDGDGDIDLVVTACGGAAVIYWNELAPDRGAAWLLDLRGSTSNRDGIGARVELTWSDGERSRTLVRESWGGGSYLSANSTRIHLAVPKPQIERCVVHWPGGKRQEVSTNTLGKPGRVIEIREPGESPRTTTQPKKERS